MCRRGKHNNNFLLDITVFLRRLTSEISMDWHKAKQKEHMGLQTSSGSVSFTQTYNGIL